MPSTNGTAPADVSKAPVSVELGEVGLRQQKGTITEEWMPQLQGPKARKVYRQMADNDTIIGSALYALGQLCRRADWRTVPADGRDEDDDTEFAESLRLDMSHSWDALIGEIMTGMPVYGFSPHEIIYKRRAGEQPTPGDSSRYSDGLLGWRKLPVRSQDTLDRWEFDVEGGLAGMWQRQTNSASVFIPIEKLALFRTSTARGNPEGRSVLRTPYRAWWFKARIEEQEAIGVEHDLTGIPHFELPEELLSPQPGPEQLAARQSFERIGKNLRRDEQAVLLTPLAYDQNGKERYRFSLLGSPGTSRVDTGPIIARHNQTIAMTLLADVILLGHEKVGTQALASSKVDLLAASLDTWLDGIAEVFNRHLLPRVFSLNGRPTGELPQYVPGSVKPDDVAATVEQIARLAQTGAPLWPDEGIMEWLSELVGFPKPDDRDLVPFGAPPAVPPPPPVMEVDETAVEGL